MDKGLSPRVRGSLLVDLAAVHVGGSIPACAGEPVLVGPRVPQGGVYPRVCGGAGPIMPFMGPVTGLSPRVRGSPGQRDTAPRRRGSIPACAGEPATPSWSRASRWVYPRVCGGAPNPLFSPTRMSGLSPRVRGSPGSVHASRICVGSIPACAGEPRSASGAATSPWVYPRVCGGAIASGMVSRTRRGLSPRVRGSPSLQGLVADRHGSIPACAGEPSGRTACPGSAWVYPRVCGGAPIASGSSPPSTGLSPRVRGSLRARTAPCLPSGSIPACAGEPQRAMASRTGLRVYPRVCGGASIRAGFRRTRLGLSPRVRGSRSQQCWWWVHPRSIPACAGEPRRLLPAGRVASVYPRVCGGASASLDTIQLGMGLSPRVRGSPRDFPARGWRAGSIPACAGEPFASLVPPTAIQVYPRVCGGATARPGWAGRGQGLSPRVRGSLTVDIRSRLVEGSIPACAGEPELQMSRVWERGVYPRVCGGASPRAADS